VCVRTENKNRNKSKILQLLGPWAFAGIEIAGGKKMKSFSFSDFSEKVMRL
jgi:hypothetical protein